MKPAPQTTRAADRGKLNAMFKFVDQKAQSRRGSRNKKQDIFRAVNEEKKLDKMKNEYDKGRREEAPKNQREEHSFNLHSDSIYSCYFKNHHLETATSKGRSQKSSFYAQAPPTVQGKTM